MTRARHVLEEPERHVKTDAVGDTLRDADGNAVLDDPHCDLCWETWPCRAARRRDAAAAERERLLDAEGSPLP